MKIIWEPEPDIINDLIVALSKDELETLCIASYNTYKECKNIEEVNDQLRSGLFGMASAKIDDEGKFILELRNYKLTLNNIEEA